MVQGVDLATGRPRLVTLESEEVLEALRPTVDAIIAALAGALDDLPPQAADDILTDGVMVFGGSTPAARVRPSWSRPRSPSRCGWPSGR